MFSGPGSLSPETESCFVQQIRELCDNAAKQESNRVLARSTRRPFALRPALQTIHEPGIHDHAQQPDHNLDKIQQAEKHIHHSLLHLTRRLGDGISQRSYLRRYILRLSPQLPTNVPARNRRNNRASLLPSTYKNTSKGARLPRTSAPHRARCHGHGHAVRAIRYTSYPGTLRP